MSVEQVLQDIRDGKIVLVYDFDDRERETDMTVASEFIDYQKIRTMRKDAGGLLCTTTPLSVANELGLPFLSDIFWDCSEKYPLLKGMAPNDIPYDRTKSSFGVTINHRNTYTGITDSDRALTIKSYTETIFADKPAEKKTKSAAEKKPSGISRENADDKLRELCGDQLVDDLEFVRLRQLISDTESAHKLYLAMIKTFGKKRGSAIYNAVKPVQEDISAAFRGTDK
jgi:3,4-dihydroxy 2-butanone 4-phosphate synthase